MPVSYEYKIFNMSEAEKRNKKSKEKKMTWLDVLNEHGAQGWKVSFKLTEHSYLLIKEIDAKLISS